VPVWELVDRGKAYLGVGQIRHCLLELKPDQPVQEELSL